MNKIEIIKSLYEELSDEEKSKIYYELLDKDNKTTEEIKSIDFYSNEFIDFITHSNYLRKSLYMFDCGKINRIYYKSLDKVIIWFETYDEAEKYYKKHFENVMKMKYEEDSNEYQCFEILSSFDFEDVEEKCEKLGYTMGLDNRLITKNELIENAVEIFRELCSKEDITFKQIGRLHAFKMSYPKEDGGNYFSLMYCIEQYDNSI